MIETLIQMAALIACGVMWRILAPGGQGAAVTRGALTGLVYYLFLPALVLLVLWQAPIGGASAKIAAAAAAGVLGSLLVAHGLCRVCSMDRPTHGAVLLASAWPNATYLGLPVLEATFGAPARSIAIQFDLFACTPLLLTLGIWIAVRYGSAPGSGMQLSGLVRVPALWAALLAVVLNVAGVPLPDILHNWLQTLANGVVPLMLISLGLSLKFHRDQVRELRSLAPVLGVQLVVMPLIAWGVAHALGLAGTTLQAVVLEAAMPSMVLGLVLCDRYGLNGTVYAAAVTATTAASFATLGLWFALVGGVPK